MENKVQQTTPNGSEDVMLLPSLDEINSQEIERLVPLIIYLVLISVTGIFGNGLVCHIYRTKYRHSNSKYFILCLSAIDLFSCALVMPFEIWMILKQYNFEGTWLCKSLRFFNTLPTVASGFMLLAIAMDRYRKVCRPLRWQIKEKQTRWICLGTILCGVIFSCPALIVYGRKTFFVSKYNLNATECSVADDMSSSIIPFINNATFGFLFLFGTSVMTILYTLIAKQIKRRSRITLSHQPFIELHIIKPNDIENFSCLNNGRQNGPGIYDCSKESPSTVAATSIENKTNSATSTDNSIIASDNMVKYDTAATAATNAIDAVDNADLTKQSDALTLARRISEEGPVPAKGSRILRKLSSSLQNTRLFSTESSTISSKDAASFGSNSMKTFYRVRQRRARRLTFLMFLISLAYVLSYLPHVLLMLVRVLSSGFVDSMTDEGRAAYKFFLRSYALNCAVNPFIYSACDKRFRVAVKGLFTGFRKIRETSV